MTPAASPPASPSISSPASAIARRSVYRGAVLIIDDEENMCKILTRFLNLEGYTVRSFTKPREALASIEREPPDVVLTDLKMPELTGDEVLKRVHELDAEIAVVMITAFGTIQGAVDALKRGAYDYITKPFQIDDILMTVARAIETRRLRQENRVLSETLGRPHGSTEELIGDSAEMQEVRRLIAKIAPSDSVVLIVGESGTGKELAARAIHRMSPRAPQRFVAINCASIPETLLESELFGYERGAFTGADRTKLGLIEIASGGTFFLDEIGDLPLSLQAKILRTLQEREIQRVGGLRNIPIDLRLLAATHRDLLKAIDDGGFRRDLFYRLNVISMQLPPLRARRSDIPQLARYFVGRYGARHGKHVTIGDDALARLQQYAWPGNVRELENIIERTIVLLDGNHIHDLDLPADLGGLGANRSRGGALEAGNAAAPGAGGASSTASGAAANGATSVSAAAEFLIESANDFREARECFEREYLSGMLRRCGGSVSDAARKTGMSRRHLYEKIERLGISLDQIKEAERGEAFLEASNLKENNK